MRWPFLFSPGPDFVELHFCVTIPRVSLIQCCRIGILLRGPGLLAAVRQNLISGGERKQ